MHQNFKYVVCLAALCSVTSFSFAQDRSMAVDSALDVMQQENGQQNEIQIIDGFETGLSDNRAVEVFEVSNDASSSYAQNIIETVDTLDVKETPLEDVLDVISSKTGIVFIVPEEIKDKVSIFVEDINVWDFLKVLLQKHGLAYYRTDGAAHIMKANVFKDRYGYDFPLPYPTQLFHVKHANVEELLPLMNKEKSPEGQIWIDAKYQNILLIDAHEHLEKLRNIVQVNDQPQVTETIELKYIVYSDVQEGIESLLTQNLGNIQVDETQKKLVITDTENQLKKIQALVKAKDIVTSVKFVFKIMRVNLNEEHLDGIDWEAIVADFQPYILKPKNASKDLWEKLSFGILTQEDYAVLIDALDTVGNLSHLISFQKEIVLNKDAMIDMETNDPFWSLRDRTKEDQENPVELDPNGFEMRANIQLKREDGRFELQFLPRLHWMTKKSEDVLFIGESPAMIDFDAAGVVVIGGLVREEEISRTQKVPLLGDLPMVGNVFRRQRTNFKNTEYIIFMMPDFVSQYKG